MPFRRPSTPRPWLVLTAAGLFAAAGCGERDGGVKVHTAPKPAGAGPVNASAADAPAADGTQYRILGAMFPADDPQWFFKLTGKADDLKPHEAGFDALLKSVRFPNGLKSPPVWTLPDGWTDTGPSGMRAATIKFGPADRPQEISVMQAMGGVKGNVDRWAGQVGATADATAKATTEVTSEAGAKGLRVDLTGPKNPSAGGMTPPFLKR